nr:nuclear receptor 2C2-associated protein isoform X1 [Bactrocera oleae]
MPRKVIKITSLTSRGAFQNMFTIAMNLLKKLPFKCSVSSVQGKDVKQYGKQHMFDSVAETSWNSSEGTPQWFQGGFAAKTLSIHAETEDGKQILEEAFYPEDINSTQSFILNQPIESKEAVKIKFLFPSSTDFFGRIILYELEIFE